MPQHASLNAEGFYAALGFTAIHQIDVQVASGVSLPSMLMICEFS